MWSDDYTDGTSFRTGALFSASVCLTLASLFLGARDASWRRWAVEHGAAHYDSKTGEWTPHEVKGEAR